jgi:hypothetical protein
MFQIRNIKTNAIFTFPTIEEALLMVSRYKNVEFVEEKKEEPKEEKDLSPIDRYIPKPKPKSKK